MNHISMYFSPSRVGFYPGVWKDDGTYTPKTWPADAVLLTEEELASYYQTTSPEGKQIGVINERPAWVELPAPLPLTREEANVLRLRAYAEPLTGSDRYFSEAQRMQVMNEEGWEAVRAAGVARYKEIQAHYPWP